MSDPSPNFILESEIILSDRQIRILDWIVNLERIEETKRESVISKYGNDIRINILDQNDKKMFINNLQYAILPNTMSHLIHREEVKKAILRILVKNRNF